MLTAAEAAAQLGVKLGTLYAYVSRGWLKSYRRRVGRQALYRRSDIDALRGVTAPERGVRARSLPDASSWVTVAQPRNDESPAGVIVAESAVSSIADGKLAYRGYPIGELVDRATFEEVCLLLWSGERPRVETIDHLRAAVAAARIPPPVIAALAAVGDSAPPLLRLSVMMPSLAAAEHRLPARSRIDQARMIISVLPLGLGNAPAPAAPRGAISGTAARLLERACLAGYDEADRAALDRMLVACAEHELNPSTFAARVVASTGADLYASVLAALCTLSGPIHGGACDRIETVFAELESGVRLDQCLNAFSARHSLPPGFGHAIYPAGDPRAALLKRVARATAARKGRKLFETALRIEEAVWKRGRLRPNLDFYLTVCTRMIGFARGMPAAIFAVGRAAGWIAHSLEQDADNRLIRPRMRYRGSPLRHWE
ncbi:MAG: helix-turn-helix domain-containing protein [Candidatus Binataceae bacterium]|nr:helix-turn-helix domain-containing protein [Candidatus Binataceae bacterium]